MGRKKQIGEIFLFLISFCDFNYVDLTRKLKD